MQIENIVAGRMYSWIYKADTEATAKGMNKGGRAGVAPNPLFGRVSSRKVYAGQAATSEMYERKAKQLNPDWQPSDRTPQFEATSHPCIVRNLATGDLQARIMNQRTVKVEYFVDGRPATSEEMELIKAYKRQRTSNPLAVKVMFPYASNLANLEGDLPNTEDSED